MPQMRDAVKILGFVAILFPVVMFVARFTGWPVLLLLLFWLDWQALNRPRSLIE